MVEIPARFVVPLRDADYAHLDHFAMFVRSDIIIILVLVLPVQQIAWRAITQLLAKIADKAITRQTLLDLHAVHAQVLVASPATKLVFVYSAQLAGFITLRRELVLIVHTLVISA